jgi:hypothetical protein
MNKRHNFRLPASWTSSLGVSGIPLVFAIPLAYKEPHQDWKKNLLGNTVHSKHIHNPIVHNVHDATAAKIPATYQRPKHAPAVARDSLDPVMLHLVQCR